MGYRDTERAAHSSSCSRLLLAHLCLDTRQQTLLPPCPGWFQKLGREAGTLSLLQGSDYRVLSLKIGGAACRDFKACRTLPYKLGPFVQIGLEKRWQAMPCFLKTVSKSGESAQEDGRRMQTEQGGALCGTQGWPRFCLSTTRGRSLSAWS